MLGKPKYTYGETVAFTFKGENKIGYIYVVDAYGTFEQSEEPSYDIMVENEKEHCLYKHFRESIIDKV